MKRPTPPTELTEAFRIAALASHHHGRDCDSDLPMRLHEGGPACWLWQFDELERPCAGRLEAIHLLGHQRIRNSLRLQLAWTRLHVPGVLSCHQELAFSPDDADRLLEQAEWDPRIAALGCTGHHRRFDAHATPALKVPALKAPDSFLDFVLDWGLEADAERRFGEEMGQLLDLRREPAEDLPVEVAGG